MVSLVDTAELFQGFSRSAASFSPHCSAERGVLALYLSLWHNRKGTWPSPIPTGCSKTPWPFSCSSLPATGGLGSSQNLSGSAQPHVVAKRNGSGPPNGPVILAACPQYARPAGDRSQPPQVGPSGPSSRSHDFFLKPRSCKDEIGPQGNFTNLHWERCNSKLKIKTRWSSNWEPWMDSLSLSS